MDSQVTIVVPVFDRAEIVGRTLDSFAAQTLRPLSVVIVDNNSTDGSLDVVRRWAELNRSADFDIAVFSERTPGASAARNAGLAQVTTPWVMFFDSDDIMLPTHAERAVRAARANPEAEIIAWDSLRINTDGSQQTLRFIMTDMVYNNLMHSSFTTQNYMARTELVRRAGAWNTAARMFDDCELGNRLLGLSPVIARAEGEPTVHVLETASSITNTAHGRVRSMMPALRAIADALPPRHRHWAELQMLIQTTRWALPDPESEPLARRIIAAQPPLRRLLFRALRRYSLAGGRGVARIYRLLTSFKFYR